MKRHLGALAIVSACSIILAVAVMVATDAAASMRHTMTGLVSPVCHFDETMAIPETVPCHYVDRSGDVVVVNQVPVAQNGGREILACPYEGEATMPCWAWSPYDERWVLVG